jgi:hypothetical protein
MSKTDLPIYPTEKMTSMQRGRCHDRFLDEALRLTKSVLKECNLKRKSRWLYRVDGYWFFSAFVTSNLQGDGMEFRAKIEVTVKPMALDPIYWHATDLAENCKKPPSFRCNAAFMLEGDTVPARFVQAGNASPAEFATALVQETADALSATKNLIGQRSYSQFLEDKGHSKLQIMKYVAALMADGRAQEAIRCIKDEEKLFTDPHASGLRHFRELIDNGVLADILAINTTWTDLPSKQ